MAKRKYKHPEETKRRMSEAKKGRKLSPEIRVKMSASAKGKHAGGLSPLFGKPRSPEIRAKISASSKGKKGTNLGKSFSRKPLRE